MFKVDPDGKSARARRFGSASRRSTPWQILAGLKPGDKVILSDITQWITRTGFASSRQQHAGSTHIAVHDALHVEISMAGTGDALIKLEGIKKAFYTDEVEHTPSRTCTFTVGEASTSPISGPSGCGKTTLLRSSASSIRRGRHLHARRRGRRGTFAADRGAVRNRQIGFIFQPST